MPEQFTFQNRAGFRDWLRKNHGQPKGIWLVFGKNNAIKTLSAEEALEEALCFGWIDGLIKRVDEKRYIKFFSPRRAKSKWSAKNRSTAEKLMKDGRMAAPGLQAIENAKRNGSWNASGRLTLTPEDIEIFAKLIVAYPQASSNFQKMPPSAKRLFAGFYKDAKQESTRHRRLEKLVGLLEQNKRPML
jgi:uncharacterized protein YdeI (YjbR/CyaY-like superfamily)